MGFSGYKGKIVYRDFHCPAYPLDGTIEVDPAADNGQWPDEVTKFSTVESANKREYGHDKSNGWQDVCYGIRRMEINLECVSHYTGVDATQYHAGQVVWLELYPFGNDCGLPMQGYAGIDRVSINVDQERGEPVGYTMTLSSKGPWTGIPGDNVTWGGFECSCDSGQTSGMF